MIEKGDAIEITSSFAFGRELVLPKIFSLFLSNLNGSEKDNPRWILLKFHLGRHIDLDGHEYGQAAESIITESIGKSIVSWRKAETAAIEAIDQRIRLWDGINDQIRLSSRERN
jgi:hypothetical protein